MYNGKIYSVSIFSSDVLSESSDSELELSVDILSSELESELIDFNISSLQIIFHFLSFLVSEIINLYYIT